MITSTAGLHLEEEMGESNRHLKASFYVPPSL